jgi:hypothetical protein
VRAAGSARGGSPGAEQFLGQRPQCLVTDQRVEQSSSAAAIVTGIDVHVDVRLTGMNPGRNVAEQTTNDREVPGAQLMADCLLQGEGACNCSE